MENSGEVIPKIDSSVEKKFETRFKKLAENTSGQLTKIEDPNIKDIIPYLISYPEKNNLSEETVRIYRGVNNIPVDEASQLPTILRSAKIIDQELIDLSVGLGNNPSEENFDKIIQKNDQIGNKTANENINQAKEFIADTMIEYNNNDYQDVFKIMHFLKNTASPYVSATNNINESLSYAMLNAPGMVIVADIPKSLIKSDQGRETVVNGPIRQEYIKSVLLVADRHSTDDKNFVQSVKSLVSSNTK